MKGDEPPDALGARRRFGASIPALALLAAAASAAPCASASALVPPRGGPRPPPGRRRRPSTVSPPPAAASGDFVGGSGDPPPPDPHSKLSAAARARRDEDRRRRERRDDVAIGRTSARPGERDCAIDPEETERLWLGQASDVEREVYLQTERGMEALRMLELEEASEAFDRVYDLKPDAYLWQAGVVQYYLDDLHAAADTFARNAVLYESKFLSPASEERIWRDACELKIASGMGKRGRRVFDMAGGDRGGGGGEGEGGAGASVARVPGGSGAYSDGLPRETRKVIRLARDLFSASVENDPPAVALSRARLRSICGSYGDPPTPDRKMWRLNSWYYLGLHYDALGEEEESKECMKMALRQGQSGGNGGDIVRTLPVLHMTRRDWYDDDDFEEDGMGMEGGRGKAATLSALRKPVIDTPTAPKYSWSSMDTPGSSSTRRSTSEKDAVDAANTVLRESISDSVHKMRLTELQDALRKRGVKSTGNKAQLRRRLVDSLLREAGFE